MKIYTANELTALGTVYAAYDAKHMARRPAGTPKGEWRAKGNYRPPLIEVRDASLKTRPRRTLVFDANGNTTDLWVLSARRVVERIDLAAPDADARLCRYVEIEPPETRGRGDSRILLRLPAALKARIADAAKTAGKSVNSWIVGAAELAL